MREDRIRFRTVPESGSCSGHIAQSTEIGDPFFGYLSGGPKSARYATGAHFVFVFQEDTSVTPLVVKKISNVKSKMIQYVYDQDA